MSHTDDKFDQLLQQSKQTYDRTIDQINKIDFLHKPYNVFKVLKVPSSIQNKHDRHLNLDLCDYVRSNIHQTNNMNVKPNILTLSDPFYDQNNVCFNLVSYDNIIAHANHTKQYLDLLTKFEHHQAQPSVHFTEHDLNQLHHFIDGDHSQAMITLEPLVQITKYMIGSTPISIRLDANTVISLLNLDVPLHLDHNCCYSDTTTKFTYYC